LQDGSIDLTGLFNYGKALHLDTVLHRSDTQVLVSGSDEKD